MDEQRAWIKLRKRKHLRLLAVVLCICLLVTTYPDIWGTLSTLAGGRQDGDGTVYVSGFAGLPEKVREQTVPLGTGIGELALPGTLEVVVTVEEEASGEESAPDQEENPDDANRAEEGGTDGGETGADTGMGDVTGTDTGTGTGGTETDETGSDETDREEETPETQDSPEAESAPTPEEESSGEEASPEDSPAPEAGDSAAAGESAGRREMRKTHTVALPVYAAENELTVETLENPAKQAGTEEQTETTEGTESVTVEGVTWQSEPAYDGNREGVYQFRAVLPEGYALMEGVGLPEIRVTVQDTAGAALIQALLERIAALPEAEAYLAEEPDIEDTEDPEAEEAYEEWMEGLYAYAEEALAIQEAYEALTVEQQAQIPAEALAKLAAWLELAEEAAGSRMMMAAAGTPTSGECGAAGSSVQWNFDTATGKLTITGTGAMADYENYMGQPWTPFLNDITDVVIEPGVTRIGNWSLAIMYQKLKSVTIPDTVTSIGDNAFYRSEVLPSVTIPKSVTHIGEFVFSQAHELTSVTILGNVESIGRGVFESCGALQAITFGGKGTVPEIAYGNLFAGSTPPCVADGAKGIMVPCTWEALGYTGKGWDDYGDHIQILHTMTHFEAVTADCTKGGNVEHWKCSDCNNLFLDAEGTNLSNLAAVQTPQLDHVYHYAAEGAVITQTCDQGCNHRATARLSLKSSVSLTYTGSAIKPGNVTYSGNWKPGDVGQPGSSAIVYTGDTVNVGTVMASLTLGNATASLTYTITSASLSGVSASGFTGTYDGKAHGITVNNVPAGATVKYGKSEGNYTLDASPAYADAGDYAVYYRISGANYTTVTGSAQISISPFDITDVMATIYRGSLTYNGKEQTCKVSMVKVNGMMLTEGTDYTLSGNTGTNAGTYRTLTITGMGNYTGKKENQEFTIAQKPITDGTVRVTIAPGPHYYTGSSVEPTVTIEDDETDTALVQGTDYTVIYTDNTQVGTDARVKVTGKGNYTGNINLIFSIEHALLPSGKSLADYVDIQPELVDGWYNDDITLKPQSGCELGETSDGMGSGEVTISEESGADGSESKKTLYVRDGEGRIYQTEFSYKLDRTPPVVNLTGMTAENGTANLWDWIVGKTSMIIKIPDSDISDALSGIAQVSYRAVPENGGEAKSGVFTASGGCYQISLNREFSGTIQLTAKDRAGNTAPAASLTAVGGKVVAEDYAPVVKITLPDTPAPNAEGWYNAQIDITVAVTDNQDSGSAAVTSGGIAQIRWKDGENGQEQTVGELPGDAPVYTETFTITADDGVHTYYVKAVDNAGNESEWQSINVKVDTGKPGFDGELTVTNPTKEGADAAFTPTEGGRAYWIVDALTEPDAQKVKELGTGNGSVQEVEAGRPEGFSITGLTPGGKHTVYVVLEDAAGNLSEVKRASFYTRQEAPAVALKDLTIDYTKETIAVPGSIGEVEVYTDPQNPEGSRLTPNGDGLPVRPGTAVYIRYPARTESGLTTPASDSAKIDIPDRPASPGQKQVRVTDTTAAVVNSTAGEEYVLVAQGGTPDWDNADTTGQFEGLIPNQAYDLYVRRKVTGNSFVSEPSRTELRTYVTIKEPVIEGEGKGKEGNTAPKPEAPNADGTVTYRGTYGEAYTPVIQAGGREYTPEMTWEAGTGRGTWEYTCPAVPGSVREVGITVELRKRALTGITVTPDALAVYADDAANGSMEALNDYVKANSHVQAAYDNRTRGAVEAAYSTTGSFAQEGAVYTYTASAEGKTGQITLTVSPLSAAVTAPDTCLQTQKAEGYTEAQVAAWLPAQVPVTYTGAGYQARTENRKVTWHTDSIGTDFGAALGKRTLTGIVDLPAWATGQDTVSIVINFVDKFVLKEEQIELTMPGFSYGAQALPTPKGSITVADTDGRYTYLYSTDGGATWVAAESLPKSDSGYLIPGGYRVKLTYTGDSYTGEKTASFTVGKNALTVLPGTLAVQDKNYDGTRNAGLKEGGQPVLSGVAAGDQVTLGGSLSAAFTGTGPKKKIPVTVTGFRLEGKDAGYYELKNTTVTLYATINNADGTPPGSSKDSNSKDSSSGNDGSSSGSDGNGGSSSGVTSGNNNGSGTPAVTAVPAAPSTDRRQPTAGADTGADQKGGTRLTPGTTKRGAKKGNTDNPENGAAVGKTDTLEPGEGPENADQAGKDSRDFAQTENRQEASQTLQASIDGGRLAIAGDVVTTGNITEASETRTVLEAGDGAVIVTVVCEEEKYAAGVRDTVAVANAVLLPEQVALVNGGETIEIRVDVTDISKTVPGQDQEVIESGLTECRKEIPSLTLGRYVDISMFVRTGGDSWDAVTHTKELIDVVVGIPEELKEEGRKFYIIRSHDGAYTLLPDTDDNPDTITVSTDMFSAYAIAYEQSDMAAVQAPGENGAECRLCHICPTFRGTCYFIWLAVIVAIILIVWMVILVISCIVMWRKSGSSNHKCGHCGF